MKKLIIITGPMGVGKTTVGKLLSDTLGKTAYIDGDWCIDIHPFVGNRETKGMAINNIVHMIRNYYHCNEVKNIVLSWVMSQSTVNKIMMSVSDLDIKIYNIVLLCDREELIRRWHRDTTTEWRVDELLEESLKSLDNYRNRNYAIEIDTCNKNIDKIVDLIIRNIENQ